MKGTGLFCINGEEQELPLFEKGDRVKSKQSSTTAIDAKGTVESTSVGGLFVYVKWDKESYLSSLGGEVKLGQCRIADGLEYIDEKEVA
ncbi:hypothetical protein ACFVS2_25755 [Brevibacillus sp. NPDC058079]|uniref:hypothetical protein n=1 Tax=Brevibacillus sp. NPDC058079 TaxID=3346330 RepID=UPI0036EB4976